MKESERGCTILYATHIFDGMDGWATHIAHISCGELSLHDASVIQGPVYLHVAAWLKTDKEKQKELEKLHGRDWRK
jgi:ABC-type uncharacterized transport system ATPase subunit